MKKHYSVVVIDVKNWEEYNKYANLAGPLLKKSVEKCGGKILSRGGNIINLEGKKINRIVLVEWPSSQDAIDFYNSSEYQHSMKFLNNKVSERFFNLIESID
tara:strand:+ start:261 stop:566 length:306 start_codon:yes stop_codon:yes gene_type:complete